MREARVDIRDGVGVGGYIREGPGDWGVVGATGGATVPVGSVWGWVGVISWVRLESHTSSNPVTPSLGRAGAGADVGVVVPGTGRAVLVSATAAEVESRRPHGHSRSSALPVCPCACVRRGASGRIGPRMPRALLDEAGCCAERRCSGERGRGGSSWIGQGRAVGQVDGLDGLSWSGGAGPALCGHDTLRPLCLSRSLRKDSARVPAPFPCLSCLPLSLPLPPPPSLLPLGQRLCQAKVVCGATQASLGQAALCAGTMPPSTPPHATVLLPRPRVGHQP